MYQKIIVGLGLEHGHGYKAMDVARELLTEGGEIIALHVIEPIPGMAKYYLPEGHEDNVKKHALEEVMKRVGDAGDAEAKILFGHPGRLIPEYAADIGADCIIVGSQRSEHGDESLGATAARIVRHASCPVHVLR